MGTSTERGFTVIELMLFVGITGALFAALMFGVTASVDQQRYRESVTTFSTLLQSQYSEVANTQNDSTNNWTCTKDGTLEQDDQTGDFRGTSPCVLLGKAIEIKNGNEIDISRVVGCEPAEDQAADQTTAPATVSICGNTNTKSAADANDLDTLKAYDPKLTTFDQDQESMEWNSTLADITSKHSALNASFLILRSPASGLLRVFAADGPLPTDLATMIDSSNPYLQKPYTMCVEGDSVIAAKQSVSIDASISGPSGVTVNQTDRDSCG